MSYKVVSPCREDWSKMLPVDGGRFCDRCNKKVYDLTTGTIPPQGQAFCGRIHETRSTQQTFKRFLWEQRPLRFLLLTLALVFRHNVKAQEPKPQPDHLEPVQDTSETPAKQITVSGTLTDKKTREAIPFGTIILTNEKHEQLGSTTTDLDGKYMIKLNEVTGGFIDIKAVYAGYISKQIIKVPLNSLKKEIHIKLEAGEFPVVGVMGYVQPLIDPFGSERVITRDQWNHMAK